MPKRTNLAISSLLALALGSAGTLLAPAATAAAPFTDAHWSAGRNFYSGGGACTPTVDKAAPADADIPTDGHSHVADQSYTGTATVGADPDDVTTMTYSQHAVGTVGSLGADPSIISMSYSGKATVAQQKTPSQCTPSGNIDTKLSFAFTLTRPMWANLTSSNRGDVYSELYIYSNSSNRYFDTYGYGFKSDAPSRLYLPAGDYAGYFEGQNSFGDPGQPMSGSGSLKATFAIPGSRSAAPSGNAKSYVGLGSARDCATHALTAKVTTNKKRARTIKKIVFSVNGHKVKTIRSHFRGRTVPLTLTDTTAATVRATVTTVQKRKHHKKIHKTRTVTSSYLACS